LQKYIDITQLGLESDKETPIAFALWPETAFPTLMGETFKYKQHPRTLRQFLRNEKLALVTGAYSTAENSDLITNSLFSLDSEGEITAPHYSKSILLAFGEYIPGESLLPKIRGWLPPTGHFAPGPGPTVLLKQGDLKLGPQICYESLFPYFSKKIADLGAQMIVNVTNDSWYGAWQEPYQHMYMTLARAVEFRRPVVRVTNTGISTAALADGTVLQRSPIHKEWFGLYDISYKEIPTPTFYQRWFWLGPALLWVALITLVLWGMRARNSSH
jgi:apolipoprotein N-acyltransferase